MSEPTSPVFDFAAVPRFRVAPAYPPSLPLSSHLSSHPSATPQTNGFSAHVAALRTPMMPPPGLSIPKGAISHRVTAHPPAPSPQSPAFYRSVVAGDAKSGDPEGAKEDEAMAALLLQPRPIPPRGPAGTTAEPVEASASGEAYERDGVTLTHEQKARKDDYFQFSYAIPAKPTSMLRPQVKQQKLSPEASVIYSKVRELLQAYGDHPLTSLPQQGSPYGQQDSVKRPVQATRAPGPVAAMPPPAYAMGVPKLMERSHAPHTSPRPKVESLFAEEARMPDQTTLDPGSSTSQHFQAAALLQHSNGGVSARSPSPAKPRSPDNKASKTASISSRSKYGHVEARYLTTKARAASVEAPKQRPKAASGSNRSTSVPRQTTQTRIRQEPEPVKMLRRGSADATNAAAVPPSQEHSRQEERPKPKVVKRGSGPTVPMPRSSPPSVDELRKTLSTKQAQLRTLVQSLQDTENDIQHVAGKKQEVDDFMNLLLAELRKPVKRPAEAASHQLDRPKTPPLPHEKTSNARLEALKQATSTLQFSRALSSHNDPAPSAPKTAVEASADSTAMLAEHNYVDTSKVQAMLAPLMHSESAREPPPEPTMLSSSIAVEARQLQDANALSTNPTSDAADSIVEPSATAPPSQRVGDSVERPVPLSSGLPATLPTPPDAIAIGLKDVLAALSEPAPTTTKSDTPQPRLSVIPEDAENDTPADSGRTSVVEEANPSKHSPHCVQCEIALATKRCHECGDDYCEACFVVIHKAGRRRDHLWTPFSPAGKVTAPSQRLGFDEVRKPSRSASSHSVPQPSQLQTMKGSLALFRKVNEQNTSPSQPPANNSSLSAKSPGAAKSSLLVAVERGMGPSPDSQAYRIAHAALHAAAQPGPMASQSRQQSAAARFVARMQAAQRPLQSNRSVSPRREVSPTSAARMKLKPFSHQALRD